MEVELLEALEFREETVGHLNDIDIPWINLPPFRHPDKDLDRVLDHFHDGNPGGEVTFRGSRDSPRRGNWFRSGLPVLQSGRVLTIRSQILRDRLFPYLPVSHSPLPR